MHALDGFTSFPFEAREMTHWVYHAGSPTDPALLVMPEIAGVAPGLIGFMRRLVDARFQVYVPWLFGPFGKRAPVRNALRLCVSREFANLRAGVSAPITEWLRDLAAHISERAGHRRVGAIGMCLTGAFAIPLVIDPTVAAAVAAQPSVPISFAHLAFGTRSARLSALNVADDEIARARTRLASGDAQLLALRCRADRLCPREKMERLRAEFPTGLEVREYGQAEDRNAVGERPHATFTKEYRLAPDANDEHHSRRAFADLVAFFEKHLR